MIESQQNSMNEEPKQKVDDVASGVKIRFRAILLGSFLALAICLITPFNNAYRQGTPLGGGHFPLAPFYFLMWMMIVTALIRTVFKGRNLLTGKELLVSWALMVALSGIAWTGLARTFFINLTAPYHFATVENRWAGVLHPLLPQNWYPRSQEAVLDFYNGLSGGRQMSWLEVVHNIPWDAWIGPLATWAGFILLCYFVMVCIINLLSRQPLYNERMNFPLLQVPFLMQEAMDNNAFGRFLTNRFLLAGLLVPVCLHLINGLSFYNPSIPSIPTLILAGKYFPKHGLFSGFYKLKIYIYPAFIGFAFLTSKQISFSFWIFFITGALLIGLLNFFGINIPAAALNVTFGPTLSRPEETQMIGAYLVFFGFLAWLARFHFLDMLLKGFGFKKDENLEQEWISTRLAFWGGCCRWIWDCALVSLFRHSVFIFVSGGRCLFPVYPGGHPGDLPGRHRLFYADRCTPRRYPGFFRLRFFHQCGPCCSRRRSKSSLCGFARISYAVFIACPQGYGQDVQQSPHIDRHHIDPGCRDRRVFSRHARTLLQIRCP